MKIKHFFIGAGVSLALALGVGAGLAMKNEKPVEVNAASVSCTFRVASTELSSWGNVSDWGIYAWHGTTPILSSFDNCYGNMSLSDGYYSKQVSYTDTIDGVILLFKQSTQKWRSTDITISGGFTDGGLYTLSYNAWVNDDDGNGRKTFSANITDETADPVYSLIGDYTGYDWETDQDMTVDTTTTTATLNNVPMAKGNSFKIRKDHAWTTTYGWSAANGHENVTDPLNRGELCFGDAGGYDHNIAVLHNGTYNFSLNYSTGVLSITGTRDASDSSIPFEIYISNGGAYTPTEMALKAGSDTEYMITRDFAAGEKFYLKFGSSYYHYSDFKENEGTIKGIQFIADGQDAKALYSGNYTIYFETASGNNYGGWFQYNSVSSAQVRENVVAYAKYFNTEVGGACDIQGKTTVISNLQTAWSNVKTRFDNAPANDIRTAIKAATASDTDEDVAEFVEKYASVYELRGNSLGTQGGDFLQKGITPKGAGLTVFGFNSNESNNSSMWIIAAVAVASLVAVGGFFFIRKRKENN